MMEDHHGAILNDMHTGQNDSGTEIAIVAPKQACCFARLDWGEIMSPCIDGSSHGDIDKKDPI